MTAPTTLSDRPLAVVTGASAGIGRVFAQRLAGRGYDLLLVARREDRLKQICQQLETSESISAEAVAADLTDDVQRRSLAERLTSSPRLAMLVNNAGFGTKGTYSQTDWAGQDAMIRLHVLAVAELTHAALRPMVQASRGSIVNVASMAAFAQSPGNVMYCSTKAWQKQFAEGLAMELRNTGITVQALCPGFTYTEFHDVMGVDREVVPRAWWMAAETVVDRCLHDLDRERWLSIPGFRYRIASWVLRLMPRALRWRLAEKRHRRVERQP